jgi:surfeit locus 1 family protein
MSEAQAGRPIASYIGVALVFAILAALGTWQMQRRAWKEALLATLAVQQALPPVTSFDPAALGCEASRGLLDPCDFRPIRLRGRIADPTEAHIFIAIPRQPNGLAGVGYWVFAVFEITDPTGPSQVWINRGFVPQGRKPPESRVDLSANAPMLLTGVIRRSEPRTWFSGANDWRNNTFYVRSPAEFDPCLLRTTTARCQPLAPFDYYIDMTGPVPATGLPYPMAGSLTIPNRHLEYALTWYGLAATWLIIALAAMRRRS